MIDPYGDPSPGGEDFDERAEYAAWATRVAEAAAAWSRSAADAEAAVGQVGPALASLRKLAAGEVSDDDQRDAGQAMGAIRAHLVTLRRIADAQAWRSAQRLAKEEGAASSPPGIAGTASCPHPAESRGRRLSAGTFDSWYQTCAACGSERLDEDEDGSPGEWMPVLDPEDAPAGFLAAAGVTGDAREWLRARYDAWRAARA